MEQCLLLGSITQRWDSMPDWVWIHDFEIARLTHAWRGPAVLSKMVKWRTWHIERMSGFDSQIAREYAWHLKKACVWFPGGHLAWLTHILGPWLDCDIAKFPFTSREPGFNSQMTKLYADSQVVNNSKEEGPGSITRVRGNLHRRFLRQFPFAFRWYIETKANWVKTDRQRALIYQVKQNSLPTLHRVNKSRP
jgi:hypothetical protein